MAVKSIELLNNWWTRTEPIFRRDIVDAVIRFLDQNARRILMVMLAASVLFTIFSCLVIGSVGFGIVPLGTPQPPPLSGYHITETYGADQFYLQLTAVAEEE